jgi:hypothetical protein
VGSTAKGVSVGKNSFRLGVNASSAYLAAFDAADIAVSPPSTGPRGDFDRTASGALACAGLTFEIYLPVKDGVASPEGLELAREILARIVELDDIARTIEDVIDSDEELAYVTVGDGEVALHYYATTVNSEWDVVFRLDDSGRWICDGIR